MDGPSKVSMDCTEVEEGYKVRYTPLLPGDYYCTIKYNHCHIVGSPYKIVVGGDQLADGGGQETTTVNVDTVVKFAKTGKSTGPFVPVFNSDANKVQAKGLALKKAYIGKQNNFTVNCSNAGKFIIMSFSCKSRLIKIIIFFLLRKQYTLCRNVWSKRPM